MFVRNMFFVYLPKQVYFHECTSHVSTLINTNFVNCIKPLIKCLVCPA